ncbi:MAG: hypothetical protein HY901_07455 [Deltaproteobacteria bacterium]|nr:hypothetical protein [Deltaproteobacteria bacterium]
MAIDLKADARRLRTVVAGCAVALLATLTVAGVQAVRPSWRSQQKASTPGIVQKATCTGAVDRCETCHPGGGRRDTGGKGARPPSHPEILAAHSRHGVGCSDCHGGSGRALEAQVAHAFPGHEATDPMMKEPHLQASCARCHVPGDTKGMERLVNGERLYSEYGCGICHPLESGGRGGWDFGPDLRAGGRRSLPYLETSLTDPAANFPESTMPTFLSLKKSDPAGFTDLVIFLESLELPRAQGACSVREKSTSLARLSCATCHAGAAGKASGRLEHRCLYFKDRKDQLTCGGCHAEEVPAAGKGEGSCPVEREHRGNCAGCHDELQGGAR